MAFEGLKDDSAFRFSLQGESETLLSLRST